MSVTFQAKIIKALTDAMIKLQSPDTTNKGTLLSEAFLWDTVESYAKKKSSECWKRLEDSKTYDISDAGTAAGTTCLAKSPHFVLNCTLTNPVRRFNPTWLAKQLKAKYKIPEPIALELCENAKQPSNPSKKLEIIEVIQS